MWKDYSSGYIKNNRSSGGAVVVAAFISALLLSLLCGLFFNVWKYEIERLELEEGRWHSRLVGTIDEGTIEKIKNYAHVKEVVIKENKTGGQGQERAVELSFDPMRAVLEDTPRIAEMAGIPPEGITYNHALLAMYLIRDPQDTAPRLLFPLFLIVTAMASFSLIVIIHNSFAVSMNGRIHQFGIFSSIGATPKQIRACLLQEAVALCAIPILLGNLLGILASKGLLHMMNVFARDVAGRQEAVFGYHPLVFGLTLLVTIITIWISAWLPAGKLSRMTPLEAIKNTGELQLKRRRSSHILKLIFGMEGELAGNALKAQRRALRTASLSLVFSSMAFTMMQCFFTMSDISTKETYFERYLDAWDIIVGVKDAEIDTFDKTALIQELSGIESVVVYQKAAAKCVIREEDMSEAMKSFGGFAHASGNYVTGTDEGWLVNAPIIILDDAGFLAYCEQIGAEPRLDGAIIRNQIRDVTNPDFRHPEFMPYIKEEKSTSILRQTGREDITAEIPVLCYTEEVPVLREEYATLDYYELVHFLPASLWRSIKEEIGGAGEDIYIRVLCGENTSLEKMNELQTEICRLLDQYWAVESENRIQAQNSNEAQIQGMMVMFGGFCVLLAVIGIGNVFSNTLGFVRQRKREFARYMSVGMTPKEIRKMITVEALVIAGRPILITLPLAVIVVGAMLRASYLGTAEFLAEAPFPPIIAFMLAICASVALAYYLGWRNIRKISLAQVLRDDTMM